jgi:hypothetical protein
MVAEVGFTDIGSPALANARAASVSATATDPLIVDGLAYISLA